MLGLRKREEAEKEGRRSVSTILCPTRSNPRANVRLSGKKRRLLAREAKRYLAEKTEREGQMEGEKNAYDSKLYLGGFTSLTFVKLIRYI